MLHTSCIFPLQLWVAALVVLIVVCLSSGAAVGPLLAGVLSAGGWDQVFYMLMTADFLALLVSQNPCPCMSHPLWACGNQDGRDMRAHM